MSERTTDEIEQWVEFVKVFKANYPPDAVAALREMIEGELRRRELEEWEPEELDA